MKVFSTYIKIAKNYKITLFLYLVIFIVLEVVVVKGQVSQVDNVFESEKTAVQIVNEDKDGILSQALILYLGNYCEVEEIEYNDEKIADALFFRMVEYVVVIPEHYSEQFFAGTTPVLGKRFIEGTYSDVYMDDMIDRYLNTISAYQKAEPEAGAAGWIAQANEVLKEQVKVSMYQDMSNVADIAVMNQSYNMTSYVVMGTLLMCVCLIMGTFHSTNIRRRNMCSPMRERELNRSLLIGNITLGTFLWLLLMITQVFLCGEILFTQMGLLMSVNLFLFMLVSVALSMLISYLVTSTNVQMAIANVMTMGLCFISGTFVSQEMLGDKINMAASFNPIHWFVKTNDLLGSANIINGDVINEVTKNSAILAGFGIVFMLLALMVGKRKRYIKAFD